MEVIKRDGEIRFVFCDFVVIWGRGYEFRVGGIVNFLMVLSERCNFSERC